jgi:hypothetical protein
MDRPALRAPRARTDAMSNNEMALMRDDGGSEMSTKLLARMVESTCRIELLGGSCGSGSLVNIRGTACVLTNHHVMGCPEEAEGAHAFFMDFLEEETVKVALDPTKFWATSPDEELDFTFCALKGSLPKFKAGRTLLPLKLSYKVPRANDAVLIVQFPRGGQRKHATQRITETEGDFTYYLCDTDYGSSGSPVFCGEEVVALHHQRSREKKANRGVVMGKVMRRLLELMKEPAQKAAANDRAKQKAAPAPAKQNAARAPAPVAQGSASASYHSSQNLHGDLMKYLMGGESGIGGMGAAGSSKSGEIAKGKGTTKAKEPSAKDLADFFYVDGKKTTADQMICPPKAGENLG